MARKNTSKKKSAGKKSNGSPPRGFAAMSKSKVKQIASMGGKASHGKMMGSERSSESAMHGSKNK